MMQTAKQFCMVALAALLTASGLAKASPPPPPPPPPPTAVPFDICRDRSNLLYERSYFFELRPCTIVASPNGRKLELASTSGPGPFKAANGKQHRLTKVVLRSFVPAKPQGGGMVAIKQTGRTLRVRLPNRLPSVLEPYIITLPRGICRADGWLVSVAVSDGTETKPFGVINSMCGPNTPKRK